MNGTPERPPEAQESSRELTLDEAIAVAILLQKNEDYTAAERREFAKASECKHRDLPALADMTPFDIADAIAGSLPINEEMFGGSDIYVKIAAAKPTSYAWK